MSSTETQTLKIIWENKGKASILKLAKELKISTDYSRLICRDLIKDKFVEFFEGEYKITDFGEEKLEKLGAIEKVSKIIKPQKPKKSTGVKREEGPKGYPEKLKKKGFRALEDIATTSVARLMETSEGLELKKAAEMINEARNKLKKEGKEYLWEA